MTNQTEEFVIADRNISGDITQPRRETVVQASAAEFLTAVDGLLAVEGVDSIRWKQYTPYFNDGEPCEFSIGEIEIRLSDAEEDAGDYEDGYEDAWSLTYYAAQGERSLPAGLAEALAGWNPAAFETVARANFGDHAEVVATPAGFEVEFYDHD